MNKEDIIILILLLALIMAAYVTFKYGGERSRHGYGLIDPGQPAVIILVRRLSSSGQDG